MNSLKLLVKRILWSAGYDVSKLQRSDNPLRAFHNDVIFDVGANVGQFAMKARASGFKGRIVSFEPLSSAHSELQMRARRDPQWIVHERVAVGAECGESVIQIAKNSASSSLLGMNATHERAAPESRYVGSEVCKVITIDSVMADYAADTDSILLKIDTQGTEDKVLLGASECLARAKVVLLELSFVELYDHQALADWYFAFMRAKNFALWDLSPVLREPKVGRLLQVDATFFRSEQ